MNIKSKIIQTLLLACLVIGPLTLIFLMIGQDTSPVVSPLSIQAVPTQSALPTPLTGSSIPVELWTQALVQKSLTKTFEVYWDAEPVEVQSAVPITTVARLETRMTQGKNIYYNLALPIIWQIPDVPYSGLFGVTDSSYIYIEPGEYILSARVVWTMSDTVTLKIGEQVREVAGNWVYIETVKIPYRYYLPLVVK